MPPPWLKNFWSTLRRFQIADSSAASRSQPPQLESEAIATALKCLTSIASFANALDRGSTSLVLGPVYEEPLDHAFRIAALSCRVPRSSTSTGFLVFGAVSRTYLIDVLRKLHCWSSSAQRRSASCPVTIKRPASAEPG